LARGPVLLAMASTPVTAVAPVRELGILVATVIGTRLLHEGHAQRRLLAAAGMVAGAPAIAMS
jgi:drug/metabolite transporter (DMT)-like permease